MGCPTAPFPFQPTRAGLQGLHALGIGSGVSSATSGAASGAAVGAAAGPIGSAVGAVAGAIVGLLSSKSNPQIQIDKTTAINFFSQYVNVAGTVSGRSIGLNNMDMVFRGACFQGHFPSWGNRTELPDSLLSMPGSPYGNNGNCFAPLWKYARTGIASPSYPNDTGNGNVPVRDAKTFVDRYVWPSNSKPDDTNPWATNTDAIGKQVIYDAADAFLAVQDPTIPPLIGQTVQLAAAVTLPATAAATVNPVGSPAPASAASGVLTPTSGGSLSTPYGTFTYSGGTWLLNGNPVGYSELTYIALGSGLVSAGYSNGGSVQWSPSAGWWIPLSAAGTNPTPSQPPAAAVSSAPPATATTTPVTAPTPTQLVSTPPAVGAPVVYAPDMGQGGIPITLPAGFVYQGQDPYNGSWILTNTGNGQPYTVWLGNVVPYTSTIFAPQSASTVGPVGSSIPIVGGASAAVGTTSSGTAITQADLQALVAQLSAQGQTAQQAYTSALQTLQNNGIAATPQVQAAVQSAVAATPAPASSNSWLGIAAVVGVVMLATAHPSKK